MSSTRSSQAPDQVSCTWPKPHLSTCGKVLKLGSLRPMGSAPFFMLLQLFRVFLNFRWCLLGVESSLSSREWSKSSIRWSKTQHLWQTQLARKLFMLLTFGPFQLTKTNWMVDGQGYRHDCISLETFCWTLQSRSNHQEWMPDDVSSCFPNATSKPPKRPDRAHRPCPFSPGFAWLGAYCKRPTPGIGRKYWEWKVSASSAISAIASAWEDFKGENGESEGNKVKLKTMQTTAHI